MENQTKEMTVKEVLTDVFNTLGNIMIPVSAMDSIGVPIARSINGIKLCLDTFEAAERQKQAQEEPEIELVELGDDNA